MIDLNIPYVINIQKYSIHDGPGIRTSVFFKGCMLNCWWCHNPESQIYHREVMFNKEKCVGCEACAHVCHQNAITIVEKIACTDSSKCDLCDTCTDYCIHNNREIVGKQYSVSELVKEIEKDKMFYEESDGGVTLSGGEVMSQDIEYLVLLVKKLKLKGYHIAIDTCGYAPKVNYEKVLPYVDTFLYDIKTLDDEVHKKYMGKSNELILSNLKTISDLGANINIRIPVIEPVNDDDVSIMAMINFLRDNIKTNKVNLLPYHNTGSSKYEKLGRNYLAKDLKSPSPERMEELKIMFINNGFTDVKVGG